MTETINYSNSFQIAKRFELYRLQKSWGIMVILTGISVSFVRIQNQLIVFLVELFHLDFSTILWNILVPINIMLYYGLLIIPFLLAIWSYRSVKKLVIEEDKVTVKQYYLFGFTLLFFYITPYLIKGILDPVIYFLFFPGSFTIEDGGIAIYIHSSLQEDASTLFFVAISFMSSFFLFRKIVKSRKLSELLYPGLIIILTFLIIVIIYQFVFISAPATPLTDLISWIIVFILGGCYFTSGYYSIKHAYKALEGKE